MDIFLRDIPDPIAAFGRSHRRPCIEGRVDVAERKPAEHANLRAGEVFRTEVLSMATNRLRDMQFYCRCKAASLFLY